jgi:GNAT superfamily N-acetyltransferase
VLHEEAGFRYLSASEASRAAIVRLLGASFAREPLAVTLGATAKDLALLIDRFIPECLGNGLSVIAVPRDEPGTVAGAFLCRDFKSPLPQGILEDLPWFLPVGQALSVVGEAYEARRPGLGIGAAVDLWMVGTDPRYARRGIARHMFALCAGLARAAGFSRCVSECTGRYSQRAAERAGFVEMARLDYRDFRFDDRLVFEGVPAPHTHLAFYEKVL